MLSHLATCQWRTVFISATRATLGFLPHFNIKHYIIFIEAASSQSQCPAVLVFSGRAYCEMPALFMSAHAA